MVNTAWHHPSYAFTHWHVLVTPLFYFNSSMWCVCESFWPSLLLGEQLHWKEKLQVLLVFHHKYCNTLRVWDTCDSSCVWLYCALKRPDHHELWGLWWKALSSRNQIFNPGNSYWNCIIYIVIQDPLHTPLHYIMNRTSWWRVDYR